MEPTGNGGEGLGTPVSVLAWEQLPPDIQLHWDELIARVSLPPLLMELAEIKLEAEQFDPARLVEIVSNDPVLAAKLLAVANSAAFGLISPISSVRRAVVHLGLNLVRSIIMAYQLEMVFAKVPRFPGLLMEYLRTWAVGVAVLSQHASEKARLSDPYVVATGGLLSRLGCLALGLGDVKPEQEYLRFSSELERLEYEQDKWRVAGPVLGGQLLRSWAIPDPLPSWVERSWEPLVRNLPEGEDEQVITIIAAATVLVSQFLADHELPSIEVVEEERYAVLKDNLARMRLDGPFMEALDRRAVRRELAGACFGIGEEDLTAM